MMTLDCTQLLKCEFRGGLGTLTKTSVTLKCHKDASCGLKGGYPNCSCNVGYFGDGAHNCYRKSSNSKIQAVLKKIQKYQSGRQKLLSQTTDKTMAKIMEGKTNIVHTALVENLSWSNINSTEIKVSSGTPKG